MKKYWLGGSLVLFVIGIIFFGIAPILLDGLINRKPNLTLPDLDKKSLQSHKDLFISDLHSDSLLWDRDLSREYKRGHVDIPRLRQGSVALQGFSVVTKTPYMLNINSNADNADSIFWLALAQRWPLSTLSNLTARATFQAERLHALAEGPANKFRVIQSKEDLKRFINDRKRDSELVAGWLTLEGAHALEGNLENLQILYQAGFRMLAPTHFFDTEVSGSAHGVDKGGLTALGRQWVREMNRRSLIIDLAHASAKTIDEVLALSEKPVLVSHTGVKGICPNQRNLSDNRLLSITGKGGLIGIGFWPTATCGENIDAVVNAVRYTVDLVGVEHVALGSDFDGAVATPIDASELPYLTQALEASGFKQNEIRKVMGENIRDFLLANLPEN